VASLNRPGGKLTGFTGMSLELAAKRLGFLHELLPRTTRFAALIDMNNLYTDSEIADLRAAASAIGRQIEILTVSTSRDIETAFASLAQKQVSGVEGRNVAVEYRWARNELDRLPELAADLVRRRVTEVCAIN
jgi:putative ABC transport system substrate-binding protein